MLRNKPSRIVFVLVLVVAVVSVGFIITLAVLAPEQLAEATTAATDLICDKCVGTTDIADGAVTSAKIGSGQVKNSDMGSSAVTSNKVADGTVTGADIASNTVGLADLADNAVQSGKIADSGVLAQDIGTNQVTSPKIGDGQVGNTEIAGNAINTAKIADGQVTGNDIASQPFGVGTGDINNGAVTTEDIANDAIKPNVHIVEGSQVTIPPGSFRVAAAHCPAGTILTGGGFNGAGDIRVLDSYPVDENTWGIAGINNGDLDDGNLTAYALCIGPSP